ncbi:MAG TPA: lytic transglycosylase F [Anaeromyxobacteraceae bacterium]|nr:lytic transglycosylase F [Anaeromyxobacteraceae bacterium]
MLLAAATLAAALSAAPPPATPAPARKLGSSLVESILEPGFGDLPAMRERGEVRVLVAYGVTGFYLRKGQPRGLEVDAMAELEKRLNARRPKGESPVRIVYVPTPFERLLPDLVAGKGDVAAGLLTVTEERKRSVDFSSPYVTDVAQVLVSHRSAPVIRTPDDLAGRTVHVPAGTSTLEGLRALSDGLVARGLAPVEVVEVRRQSWEDLLQMVASGMFAHTVTDDFLARLWATAVPALRVEALSPLRTGGELAWAVRKDSPALRAALDDLARRRTNRSDREAAESIRRYTRDPRRLRNALGPAVDAKLGTLRTPMQEASRQHGFDWLLIAALAFQESRLDPKARNASGAVGLLQVLPETGKWLGYPDVHPVRENVLAGTAYLALLRRDHFDDPDIELEDRIHFSLAAYNAGPGRIARLRRQAAARGLDPNVWFGNVELEAYREIGQETPRYVANIVRYYLAYRLASERVKPALDGTRSPAQDGAARTPPTRAGQL